jgi:predicted transposase/invertase (TIGR01784 family)
MPRHTLDPKIDVVFKMLFTDERNLHLLTALLQDFLQPNSPITAVEVLNPELRRDNISDRGGIVDLLVQFDGGARVHVEMQLSSQPFFVERALFYWARAYSGQLSEGDHYGELSPTTGIFILNYYELRTESYHSTFRLLEGSTHERLSSALELHFLELPKIPGQPPDDGADPVLRWGQFFRATSDERLQELAMSDPILREASDALQRLSDDPVAREEAFKRQLEWSNYQHSLQREREQGIEQGISRGLERAIEQMCRAFGIDMGPDRLAILRDSSADELLKLHESIATSRSWPK